MITRDNLTDVLGLLSQTDKDIIINDTDNEYLILELSVFNAGGVLHYKLVNDLDPDLSEELSANGNCILETEEIKEMLTNLEVT